ncbi:MAG: glycosyltransferase family 4 protein [bacterium]|nr:glycosyltransferase family 4 protein [bacterium]MCP4798872.1 glycosyltransferase family 4 protein [bacterium]
MRILNILSQRPDSTGSGVFIEAMIRQSTDCGHENYLIAGLTPTCTAQRDWIADEFTSFVRFEDDVSFTIPGMSDVMPYDSSRFCDLSPENIDEYEAAFSKVISKAVAEFKPDVIHSNHLWLVSSLTRQLFPEIKMVTTCMGSDLRQFGNCKHLQSRVLEGCRGIDTVFALSEIQKNEISELYGINSEKIEVIGAGYNDELFTKSVKPDPDPVQIVYAGKLSNAKGVPWMLRALAEIDSPNWKLHLLGGGAGQEKENCLQLASKLGDRVEIYGAVPQKRLAEVMKLSHVMILPSFFEGLPLVVLEALASGCRVVVTELPGVEEILGDAEYDSVSLVELPRLCNIDTPYKEDESAFIQNLSCAIEEQICRAGNESEISFIELQNVIDSFTWKTVFTKADSVYKKLF